jgi:dihydroneopterin aldolase
MITCIELKEIRFYAYHGVMEQERLVGNQFVVDVLLTVPLEEAMRSDDLNDTINYARVYEVIQSEMTIPSNLLEHVAGRILSALKRTFPQLTAIELKVSKLNPPMGGEIESASVKVRQTY